jgi:hypothetical protein
MANKELRSNFAPGTTRLGVDLARWTRRDLRGRGPSDSRAGHGRICARAALLASQKSLKAPRVSANRNVRSASIVGRFLIDIYAMPVSFATMSTVGVLDTQNAWRSV